MEFPLPLTLACELTVKAESRLEGCRDKGIMTTFSIDVAEGYDVLRAKVKAFFEGHEDLVWNEETEIYVKPSNYASQKAYILLQDSVFLDTVKSIWHKARLRTGEHIGFKVQLFVYVKKKQKQPVTTLHRATEKNVQANIPIVQAAFEREGVSFGPASLRYAAIAQARLPADRPVEVPQGITFQQLQHIDRLQLQADLSIGSTPDAGFATVDILMNGQCVPCGIRVADLRLALGLLAYPLYPPYRDPIVVVPPPCEDMEDVDHRDSDDDIADA